MSAPNSAECHLFLIRHAQSGNNAQDESMRVCDPSITEVGHEQARRVAASLTEIEFEALICSAFRRALQTADYIRHVVGRSPEVVVDMHEHGGCYEGWHADNFAGQPGLKEQEILEEFGAVQLPDDFPQDGWWGSKPRESHRESSQRADRMAVYLQERINAAKSNLVCVTHADFLSKLILSMFGDSIRDHQKYDDLKNVSVTTVAHQNGQWELIEMNSVDFLPAQLVTS